MKCLIIIFFSLISSMSFAGSFVSQQVIINCDMSTASCASYGIKMDTMEIASFQAVMSGSPVGTLKVQLSNDIATPSNGPDKSLNVVNWTDYTGSSEAISASGTFVYNLLNSGYGWVRLVYTKTSGTGTLNATFRAKTP